jgi:uncharacterized protein
MQDVISSMADAQKLASVRRTVEGTLALAQRPRLEGLVQDTGGSVRYRMEFDVDIVQRPIVRVQLDGFARLLCQRSLETFDYSIKAESKLAFIADEADESSLMPDFDPVLVGVGEITLIEIVEDEVILQIPAIAINAAKISAEDAAKPMHWESPAEKQSPFAALAGLMGKKN